MRRVAFSCGWACLLFVLASAARTRGDLPAHPSGIDFPELEYRLPPAAELRTTLSNGIPVYIAEDRMLPTFDMTVVLRTGGALDPQDKAGLASLTGEQMRDGGTKNLPPEELDERVEFLAARLRSSIGDTSGEASVSTLSKDVDAGLSLLVEMLRYPRFDDTRLRLAKERMLQNIKRRNDSTASIAGIEWGFRMNGPDHFSNRYPSSSSINNITRDDLVGFHKRYIHPGNMLIAVSGDFSRAEMLSKLEQAFSDWPVGEPGPKGFPDSYHEPPTGVFVVNKEDVNQGRVTIGHKAIMRGTPDEFPLIVMNGILGGAGFKSRLFQRVRSDEGLAYNTGSRFEQGVWYPGSFSAWFQSKNSSCAYATKIVIEEIERLINQEPGKQEVDEVIAYYVESFPQRFPTKMAILETYLRDEYTGRDPGFWQTYVEKLEAVTPADVHAVANRHLRPGSLTIVAVGDADELLAGGHDKAPHLTFSQFGSVKALAPRDPDTLTR